MLTMRSLLWDKEQLILARPLQVEILLQLEEILLQQLLEEIRQKQVETPLLKEVEPILMGAQQLTAILMLHLRLSHQMSQLL